MADINTSIALITKYSTTNFDKVYKADATSSILAKDSEMVQFRGVKTVLVAKLAFGGLHDYRRNNLGDPRVSGIKPYGYQGSNAGLTWEEHQLRMDRAARYDIEQFDNEESGDVVMGHALTEINRTQIVPEIDAYCWSEIYHQAGKVVYESTKPANNKYLPFLNAGILWEQNHEVPDNDQVIIACPEFMNDLRESDDVYKRLDQSDYQKNVSFTVTKYEGRELVVVPPQRFKTNYIFGDGFFAPAQAGDVVRDDLGNLSVTVAAKTNATDAPTRANPAELIDFIIMPKNAACHVVKFQKTRVLSGDIATAMSNQDGYVLLARIYHDVIVFDNRKVAIYAHVGLCGQTDETKMEKTYLNVEYDKNGVITRIVETPGDVLALLVNGSVPTYDPDAIYSAGILHVGSKLTPGGTITLVVNNRIVTPTGGAITVPETITAKGSIAVEFTH